jgi:hypothetical protein
MRETELNKPYCYNTTGVSVYGSSCKGTAKFNVWDKKQKIYVIKVKECNIKSQCGFYYENKPKQS